MDIPRPNISKQEINLPLWARLILFIFWPILMAFIIIVMALVWLILPFKATITLKN